jgi:hypothetical protein
VNQALHGERPSWAWAAGKFAEVQRLFEALQDGMEQMKERLLRGEVNDANGYVSPI